MSVYILCIHLPYYSPFGISNNHINNSSLIFFTCFVLDTVGKGYHFCRVFLFLSVDIGIFSLRPELHVSRMGRGLGKISSKKGVRTLKKRGGNTPRSTHKIYFY